MARSASPSPSPTRPGLRSRLRDPTLSLTRLHPFPGQARGQIIGRGDTEPFPEVTDQSPECNYPTPFAGTSWINKTAGRCLRIYRFERIVVTLEMRGVGICQPGQTPPPAPGSRSHYFAGRANNESVVRDLLALGNQRMSTDDGIPSDAGTVQYRSPHADKGTIANSAAVQCRLMPDGDSLANLKRKTGICMKHAIVLNIAALTNGDRLVIAAHNGAEPHGRTRFLE